MKGWLFTKTHDPLIFTEKEDPIAGPGEVVIDIKASGLCLTDLHVMEQEFYMAIATGAPMYLGHECAGVVESVGEGVTDIQVGDRVAVEKAVNPATNECIGFTQDGGYASKIRVFARQCVKMPDNVTFAQAASSTCAGQTAYHATFGQGGAKAGSKVGVIGIGGIGQYVVGMAAARGCQVYAASRNPVAREMALSLGAKKTATSIAEFADEGLEIIIDCAGSNKTINDAIKVVSYGGTVVLVGMMEKDIVIQDASALGGLVLKEVSLKGCCNGFKSDIEGIFELIASGKYNPELSLIPFEEIDKGLELLKNGKVDGKLVAVQD